MVAYRMWFVNFRNSPSILLKTPSLYRLFLALGSGVAGTPVNRALPSLQPISGINIFLIFTLLASSAFTQTADGFLGWYTARGSGNISKTGAFTPLAYNAALGRWAVVPMLGFPGYIDFSTDYSGSVPVEGRLLFRILSDGNLLNSSAEYALSVTTHEATTFSAEYDLQNAAIPEGQSGIVLQLGYKIGANETMIAQSSIAKALTDTFSITVPGDTVFTIFIRGHPYTYLSLSRIKMRSVLSPHITIATGLKNTLHIDYSGYLEKSLDLATWRRVDPQEQFPHIETFTEAQVFFRATKPSD